MRHYSNFLLSCKLEFILVAIYTNFFTAKRLKMAKHIMLSYQWDLQDLVKRVFQSLKNRGLPVWMDVEGGMSGNINDR